MPVIAINGVDLHYDDTGAGDRVVLFLAGPWFDRRLFDRQVASLVGFRRIAFDHRGLGRSGGAGTAAIPLDALAADVMALVDALCLPPLDLVGHDLGAEVALRVAARAPHRVRSVMLMGIRPAPTAATRRRHAVAARLARHPRVLGPLLPARLFGAPFRADSARTADRRQWARRLSSLSAGVPPVLRGLAERGPWALPSCPALVLTGDAQPPAALDAASRLHEKLPDSRLVRIPLAGSAMPIEQPEAVDAALRAFLAKSAVTRRARDDHAGGTDLVV